MAYCHTSGGYFVTEKDQDAAIGAAVRLLAQAKHHRAALVAEAKQMAAAMSSLEHDLHFKALLKFMWVRNWLKGLQEAQ